MILEEMRRLVRSIDNMEGLERERTLLKIIELETQYLSLTTKE